MIFSRSCFRYFFSANLFLMFCAACHSQNCRCDSGQIDGQAARKPSPWSAIQTLGFGRPSKITRSTQSKVKRQALELSDITKMRSLISKRGGDGEIASDRCASRYRDGYTNSSSSQALYPALLLRRSQPRAHTLEAEHIPHLVCQRALHPLEEAARQVVHGQQL